MYPLNIAHSKLLFNLYSFTFLFIWSCISILEILLEFKDILAVQYFFKIYQNLNDKKMTKTTKTFVINMLW